MPDQPTATLRKITAHTWQGTLNDCTEANPLKNR